MKPLIILIQAFILLTSTVFKYSGLSKTSVSPDTIVTAIGVSEKHFWIGTTKGLWKIKRSNGKTVHYHKGNSMLPSDNISSIAVEPDGNLWVGTDKGIMRYDNYTFYTLTSDNTSIPDCNITSIAIDDLDRIWLGTSTGGITLIKKNKKMLQFNSGNSNFYSDSIRRLISDINGAVCVEFSNGRHSTLKYSCNKLETREIKKPCQLVSICGIVVSFAQKTMLLHVDSSIGKIPGDKQMPAFALKTLSGYNREIKTARDSVQTQYLENLKTEISTYLTYKDSRIAFHISQDDN